MPPRSNLLAQTLTRRQCLTCLRPSLSLLSSPISSPFPSSNSTSSPSSSLRLRQQQRYASILSSISDVPSSYKKRIRRGRGPSSGKGKTSGRGHKGQKQHGKVPAAFQGGQTPLEIAKGVRGFQNQFSLDLSVVNVDKLQHWIDSGRIDISKPVTPKELHESRLAHSVRDGIKLLARNTEALRSPVHITVSRASKAAIAAVERVGGTVQTRYYTKAAIKRILKGQMHPTQSIMSLTSATTSPTLPTNTNIEKETITGDEGTSSTPNNAEIQSIIQDPYRPLSEYRYRLPDAFSRKDMEYYRDQAYRGYLSYQVADGHSPSLFYKAPPKNPMSLAQRLKLKKKKAGKSDRPEDPTLW